MVYAFDAISRRGQHVQGRTVGYGTSLLWMELEQGHIIRRNTADLMINIHFYMQLKLLF